MARRFGYGDDLGIGVGAPGVAGPLIGGGVTQVGTLATKLIFKDRPNVVKWSGAIGLALGAGVSAILAARRRTRALGVSGLVTAAIVGLPPLIEGAMSGTFKDGYLGVVTAEEQAMMGGFGAEGVQLLDSAGSAGLGVVTAEEQMNGAEGVDLLGAGGAFGANFWTEQ